MKQRILFSIALAGLMLGSCSKDAIDGGNGASWNENGEGFISLSLNIPATTGTASRANGDFVDGEAGEFAVNDAILLLFTNENADNAEEATFNSAYNLSMGNWEDNASGQITSTARIVQQINEIEASYIYALVVLNHNDVISVTEKNGLNVNETAWTANTLANLNETVAKVTEKGTWSTNGYLMSNSPLYSDAVTSDSPSGTVSTLAKIDASKIFPTAEEATANPAGTIFVERAQAKVQVMNNTTTSPNNNTFTIKDGAGTDVTYTYTLTNWELDNYNTQSTLTRQFDDDWAGHSNSLLTTANYRFVDDEEVKTNCGYRTYWGEDVNYEQTDFTDGVADPKLINKAGSADPTTIDNTFGSYVYCLENTSGSVSPFAYELTRIIVKAKLKKGENEAADFFTVSGDRSIIYTNDAAAGDASIQKRIKSYLVNNSLVAKAVSEAKPTNAFTESNLTVTLSIDDNNSGILNNKTDITVALINESSIGINEFEKTAIETAIKNALYTDVESKVTNVINFDYYKGGICYYDAFIRHFNDKNEAPLKSTDGNTDANVDAKDRLGRYGVVRNNWYVLNVNSVKGIGDSTVPELPAEPVDAEEFFLSVEINIMPWAKRTQEVDL